ncbi:HNH endonuclease [Peribacillus butanolivorans]|uniref:HNH endonuclease n=1 Tax=Peribacillus butanolivorans TaxID=421767 RepID=UPI0035D87FDC
MNHVILQPSGGAGKANFDNTIKSPVPLEKIIPFLDEKDVQAVSSHYENGLVPVWGVTPGASDTNRNKWDRIHTGDIALFTANMKIFSSGTVTHKFHSQELALELWGWKEEGVTWEYIYILDEIEERNVPVQLMNEAVGYSTNKAVMGFTVLNDEKSNILLNTFNFQSEVYQPSVSEEEYKESILELDTSKPLDTKNVTYRRTEQAFLRKYLFANKKLGTCGVCIKEMPVEFLVAAHIKKRSECTDDEKVDYRNIVMPMCKFGCDDLYEKGFITVQNGLVVSLKSVSSIHVENYINSISGNRCVYWNCNSENFFNWHHNYHLKRI